MVPVNSTVIDVGADRGLLSLSLSELGHKVYAIENKKGPFSLLCQYIEENHSSVTPILSDGLDTLPSDVDTAILLGMGGETIYEILSRNPEKLRQLKTIIIEPQSIPDKPIQYLLDKGFINDLGEYVFEKRYYPLLRFAQSEEKKAYTKEEIFFGPYPYQHKDQLLILHLRNELNRFGRLSEEGKERNREGISFLRSALERLSEMDFTSIKEFHGLSMDAMKIRREVFMNEQGFKDEFDEIDKIAISVVGYLEDKPVGCCRIFFDEDDKLYKIGRFAVLKEYRGSHLGLKLVSYSLSLARKMGAEEVYLHAQVQAKSFYEKAGFEAYGDIGYEEHCPHIWMKKKI